MTTIQSCDHHDETGLVPDSRSRKRILEQFARAQEFGDLFLNLVRGSTLDINLLAHGAPLLEPTITIQMGKFLDVWTAYVLWQRSSPYGDDLRPAYDPTAGVRIPLLDDLEPAEA